MSGGRYTIAIQARTGSRRLPGKMSRAFYDNKTILELIIEELLDTFAADNIVVATSKQSSDDALQEIAVCYGVRCSRGSENDVLGRVWAAVERDDVEYVVRICADNPFLRSRFVSELLMAGRQTKSDYVSFALLDGTPSILSHLGLFAEAIHKQTLQRIAAVAESARHREHLTSHILDFPDRYTQHFLPVPDYIAALPSMRLTVDTESDFVTCQQLYATVRQHYGAQFTAPQLVATLEAETHLHERMAREILANEKQ